MSVVRPVFMATPPTACPSPAGLSGSLQNSTQCLRPPLCPFQRPGAHRAFPYRHSLSIAQDHHSKSHSGSVTEGQQQRGTSVHRRAT